jgi:Zn-dependent protease
MLEQYIYNYPQIFITIVFLFSLLVGLVVHECAHAWTANRYGDPTAKYAGRLTLNPLAHLDPIGTLMLFLVHFGWAKPVPVNENNLKNDLAIIKVALSGITANLLLALIFGLPLRIATILGVAHDTSLILIVLNYFVGAQLILIALNIIPIPPLDGSRVLGSLFTHEARTKFEYYGPIILMILIASSFLFGIPIIQSFMEPIIRFLNFIVVGTYTSIF